MASPDSQIKLDTRLRVGVTFGGVSPEHEVSIISSLQAIAALDRELYEPVPIYIAKDGSWYTGDALLEIEAYQDLDKVRSDSILVSPDAGEFGRLRLVEKRRGGIFSFKPREFSVDVVFIGLHGGSGEDGGVQGLCEAFNVPYTGSSIIGSAVGMDKVISKMLCRDQDIPVVDFVAFRESEWAGREEEWLDRCEEQLGYPVIVKPARLGSSIGIGKADDRPELDRTIEEALRYDEKIIVEHAVQRLKEINCAVLGDPNEAVTSMLEQPIRSEGQELLTFQEKYMRGQESGAKEVRRGAKSSRESQGGMASLDRIIPAPLEEQDAARIRDLAIRVFQLFECAGVARIDFMIDEATGEVFFNEINTIPGSFSFYLWDPAGVPFNELLQRMIEVGMKRHRDRNSRVRTYDVNLLSQRSLKGLKGSKKGGR
ncbi:MAG: D-alanine--D-alanine ligase family protein, partial [Rhodothermales bacterium]